MAGPRGLPDHLKDLDDRIYALRHRLNESVEGSEEEMEVLIELRMLRVRYDQGEGEQDPRQ